MHVQRLCTAAELSSLADDWNCLSRDVPLRSYEWLSSWWANYEEAGMELFVLAVRTADGELLGLAPWYIAEVGAQGRLVQCLGSGHVCSDYQTILTAAEREEEVLAALTDWLIAAAEGSGQAGEKNTHRWDALALEAINANDATMARLVENLWTAGCSIHRRAALNCWRIDLPPTWDEYQMMLSKSLRKQVRQGERRVFDSGLGVLKQVTTPEDLAQGMAILRDLHQRRRQSLGEPGCYASDRFAGFMNTVAPRLLARGCLRLWWLELDGRPAAVEFQMEGEGVTYCYQTGIEIELMGHDPGRLIQAATIKSSIERGQKEFDFLRGDEPYKSHWRGTARENTDLRVVPGRTVSRLRNGFWLAGDSFKSWIKTGLQLAGMR